MRMNILKTLKRSSPSLDLHLWLGRAPGGWRIGRVARPSRCACHTRAHLRHATEHRVQADAQTAARSSSSMASSTFRPEATTNSWSSAGLSMRISTNGRRRGGVKSDGQRRWAVRDYFCTVVPLLGDLHISFAHRWPVTPAAVAASHPRRPRHLVEHSLNTNTCEG